MLALGLAAAALAAHVGAPPDDPADRGRGRGRRRRRRWLALRSGARRPAGRRPAPTATSTSTSARRVQVDAWNADGTATRALPRRAMDGRARAAAHAGAPARTASREVDRQPPRRREDLNHEPQEEQHPWTVATRHPGHRRHLHHASPSRSCRSRTPGCVERLGKYHGTLTPGPQLPDALHRQGRLQAQPEGNPARRAEPGLHHARQHAAAGRRHPLLPGDRPDARELRLVQLHRGRHPARADLAAQRDRQAGARQDLRGARHHQRPGGRRPSTRPRSTGA